MFIKIICELNDQIILQQDGRSQKAPRLTVRAIVRSACGLYAVMYSEKFNLYSLPGGGVEDGEDVLTALRREIYEETGCACDKVRELGVVAENRASLDNTQLNYYYVVDTSSNDKDNHLTGEEKQNHMQVQWHTLDEMVRLITNQTFALVQQKYLHARDMAALDEYVKRMQVK